MLISSLVVLGIVFGLPDQMARYVSISRSPQKLSEFWIREAKYLELREIEWTLDPSAICRHIITILPATVETQAAPLLLIHRPNPSSDLKIEEIAEGDISSGALAGFIDWMALTSLMNQKRSRDIFFVKSCGDEAWSKYGTRDLVHYLIRSLPGESYSWNVFQKVEAGSVWAKFPELRKVELVLSHSVPAFHFDGHSEIYLPIVAASKGYWRGVAEGDLQPTLAVLQARQKTVVNTWRSLHAELDDFASVARATLPWWQQIIVWLRSRFFFRFYSWESMIESEWTQVPQKNGLSVLEYDFLGDREQREIEREVLTLQSNMKTEDYIPFRRSFLRSADSTSMMKALNQQSGLRVFSYIAPHVSDSSIFRWAGIEAYDVFPLAVRWKAPKPFSVSLAQIQQAIDIKRGILQKLVQ